MKALRWCDTWSSFNGHEKKTNKTSARKEHNSALTSRKWYQDFVRFVELRGNAPRTRQCYLSWVRRLHEAHPGRHTARLHESEVLDFLIAQREERDLEDSTLNQAVCALRCFYREHLGRDWEGWNKIKIRREEQLPNIISREEVARLLSGVHQGRFRAVFTLMYHCGLRLSEATHLKPGHIDSSRGVLRVVHANSKSKKDREVPVSPELIARLRAFWKQHRNPQWLFPAPGRGWKGGGTTLATAMGRSTKPMSTSSVQAAMRATVLSLGWDKRRGYRPVTCHTLRHVYS